MAVHTLPAVRPLDLDPVEHEGQQTFALSDPQRISDETLVLTPMAAWILQHLNGDFNRSELNQRFQEQTGDELPDGTVQELVNTLDKHYMLDNERFQERLEQLKTDYAEADCRSSVLMGQGMPESASDAEQLFDDLFSPATDTQPAKQPDGLLMPHIDYRRGVDSYNYVLPRLKSLGDIDRIVILGISHQPCEVPFGVTTKPFQTPWGNVPVDKQAAERVQQSLPWDDQKGDWAIRSEHSLEIPVHLLQYQNHPEDIQILPVICSFANRRQVEQHWNQIHDTLREILDGSSFLIASVDFAHVGPEFGDPDRLDKDDFKRIDRRDQSMLDHLEAGTLDGFEDHIQSDDNQRRVCGYPAMSSTLGLIDSARTVHYDQWDDPQGTVSFGVADLFL